MMIGPEPMIITFLISLDLGMEFLSACRAWHMLTIFHPFAPQHVPQAAVGDSLID
jgi:hypothetical protein